MNRIEVIFSPALYETRTLQSGFLTVVVDVLRATTAFCAAFDAGVESLLPVAELDELRILKSQGYLTAAEREGKKIDFADFGNSPVLFRQSELKGKKLAYSTTNGTRAIDLAKPNGTLVIASFSNLEAVTAWLINQQKDILILCSGWKDSLSLEDSVCAGALTTGLINSARYAVGSDSANIAVELWNKSRNDLQSYCSKGSHFQRLEKLGLIDDLSFCFKLNTSTAVPVWNGEYIVDLNRIRN